MKNLAILMCAFGLIASGTAAADDCPNPESINCGQEKFGRSFLGNIRSYSCMGDASGPEEYYELTLSVGALVTASVEPYAGDDPWDVTIAILPEVGGDCDPDACIVGADDAGDGDEEIVTALLGPGTYYIVVDGDTTFDEGQFYVSAECVLCDNCVDADSDGHWAYDAAGCPCGDDCDDSDDGAYPGAPEICGDGIDQDCDNQDEPCPPCVINAAVACGDSGSADTNSGNASLNSYCAATAADWNAKEYLFTITPAAGGAVDFTASNLGGQQLDVFALDNYSPGACDQDACVDSSLQTTGTQRVAFYAQAGETYLISVDGRNGAAGTFDYAVACTSEQCTQNGTLSCADSIPGDNSAGTNNVNAYPGLSRHLFGPEDAYAFSTTEDSLVTVTLSIDAPGGIPPDLALLAIDGGTCLPASVIAISDLIQNDQSNPPEEINFQTTAGAAYFVVVDGRKDSDAGGYTLAADCTLNCSGGRTDCGGVCVDTNTDLQNCGGCGTVCSVANGTAGCTGGNCVVDSCDLGYADCSGGYADGCETTLGTDQNCAGCGDACDYPHASGSCSGGACTMGACDTGWGDCSGGDADGCETQLNTSQNCGACGTVCTAPEFCDQGSCTDQCSGGLTNCGGSCVDTSSDLQNCGACGTVCTVTNGTAGCQGGSCVIVSCDSGFADCTNGYANGCETTLGTDQNCSDCGDACEYAHASGSCNGGVCGMGACEAGWGDCSGGAADGCETSLTSNQNCGSCGNACGTGENCVGGQCSSTCGDADGDGHADQACGGDDCDDSDDSIHPEAQDICGDGIDQDCTGGDQPCTCEDSDGDGHPAESCGGDDCDDGNGSIYPGALETCGDEIDQNCDGHDEPCACVDADGDGHPLASCGGDDCDDDNASIHPGAIDNCDDGIDQNCDGEDRSCGSDPGCGCYGGSNGTGSSRLPLLIIILGALVGLARRRNA